MFKVISLMTLVFSMKFCDSISIPKYQWSKMDSIFAVVKPFLVFLNFCGLFNSSYTLKTLKGRFTFSWLGLALSVLNLSILFFFISSPYEFDASFYMSSSILLKAWDILSTIDLLTYVLSLIYQLCRQSNIKRFLSLVNEFDNQVFNY